MLRFQLPLLAPLPPPPPEKGKIELPQKFKPPQSGKIINICAEKSVTTRGYHKKKLSGEGKFKNLPPPLPCGERDPHAEKETPTWRKGPPYRERDPPHGENDPHVERNDCMPT